MSDILLSAEDMGKKMGQMMYDWQKGVKQGESSIYIIRFTDEFDGGYALTDGHILFRMTEKTAQAAKDKFESYSKIERPDPEKEIKDLKVDQAFKYLPKFKGLVFHDNNVPNVLDLLPSSRQWDKSEKPFNGHILESFNYSLSIDGSSDARIYGAFNGEPEMGNFDYFTFLAKKYVESDFMETLMRVSIDYLAQDDKDSIVVMCGSQIKETWAGLVMPISADTLPNKMSWLSRVDLEELEEIHQG